MPYSMRTWRRRILSLAVCTGILLGTLSASAFPPCDWENGECPGQYFSVQGDSTRGPASPHDFSLSTVAYPGNYPILESEPLELPNGQCLFIVNQSQHTYFVPLKSETEWKDFEHQVNVGTVPGLSFASCGLDPNGNPTNTTALCGTANGIATTSPPSASLCDKGTASSVQSTGICSWSWTCKGDSEEGTTVCQAPKVNQSTATVVTGPAQLIIIVDASSSMSQLVDAAGNAVSQVLQQFLTAHPNVNIKIVVLGGDGYNPNNSDKACHYGLVYNSASPGGNGAGNNYGLASVESGFHTPLADAINYSGQMLNPAAARTAMLVLTDGAETCDGDFDGAIQAQRNRGVKMFAIAYQDSSYSPNNFTAFDSTVTANSDQAILDALNNALILATNDSCP